MANLNSESYHSLIGFLTAEYLRFLKLQVVPRFMGTGTCISPVPVNRGYLNLFNDKTQFVHMYFCVAYLLIY